jgi:anti-sigma factor RsiW
MWIPCRDIIALLTEYMEGALPRDSAAALEAHLALCPPCVEFLDSLNKTAAALRDLGEDAIPAECRQRLRDFLARELTGRSSSG